MANRNIPASALIFCSLFLPDWLVAQAPPTIAEALTERGISLSTTALMEALKDPRPDVRALAAGELAEKKDFDAIPLLRKALDKENTFSGKLNIASALMTMGDQEGRTTLQEICNSHEAGDFDRMIAADRIMELGDDSCVPAVVDILSKTPDPAMRQFALEFLRKLKTFDPALMPKLHIGLLSALQEQSSAVRQAASECIALQRDKAAAPYLRKAIAIETDKNVRLSMEKNLKTLELVSP